MAPSPPPLLTRAGARRALSLSARRYDPCGCNSSSNALNCVADAGVCDDKVVGVEVALWGEWLDPSNLEANLALRGAAFAERAWSPAARDHRPRFDDDAQDRLARTRCRLHERGIAAAPRGLSLANAETIGANPTGPGSCYEQR